MRIASRIALFLLVTLLVGVPGEVPARQSEQPDRSDADHPTVLEGLGGLARHRAYPFVERAQRAVAAGEFDRAAEHWRAALDRAPGHVPLIRALAESLLAAGSYAAVESLLKSSPEAPELSALRHQVRLDWLASDASPPDVTQWVEWLSSATESEARALVDAFAFAVREREGVAAVLDGLSRVPCPGPGCQHALQRRVVMAEQARKWQAVVDALRQIRTLRGWSEDDRRRALSAWMAMGNWKAVESWLLEERSARDVVLLRTAIENAIGQAQWGSARRLLEALKREHGLREDDADQLAQVYRELGDLERAAHLARERGQCLRAVALIRDSGRAQQARDWLGRCAARPPGQWLNLAIGLEAVDLLARQQFDRRDMEDRRIEALAVLLQRRGEDDRLIELLRPESGRAAQKQLLAALERQARYREAADVVMRRFEASGRSADLERATYFYLLADDRQQAARLLIQSAPFDNDPAGRQLSRRLLTLYPLPDVDPEGQAIVKIARATSDPDLRLDAASTLQSIGRCAEVRALDLESSGSRAGESHMVLGFCLQGEAPGLAAHHFERAVATGVKQARGPLAVTLFESGQPERTLQTLERMEAESGLNEAQRELRVEAALEAGRYPLARDAHARMPRDADDPRWWSMRARIARGLGEDEKALEAWQTLAQRWPSAEAQFQIGVLQYEAEDFQAAVEALGRAVDMAPDNPEYLAEFAYAMEQVDPDAAVDPFRRALEREPWRYALHEQLGYIQARLHRTEAARQSLRLAADRLRPELAPVDLSREETLKRSYRVRRSHESLGRRWRFAVTGWAASGSVPGEFFFDSDPPRNYGNVIVDRQLGPESALGSLHARARLIGQGSSDNPLSERAATLGVTWHLPGIEAVVGMDWLEPEHGTGEVLLHAASQWLNAGRYRRDWRPATAEWQERRLYIEGAWWVRSDDYLVSARFDHAWHRAIEEWSAASWFTYLNAESRLIRSGHDIRVGLGLGLRKWTGETRYDAHRRVHTLRLEFQHALETNIADRNGVFLRMESEW